MKYFKTDGIRMNANDLIFSLLPLKLGKILGQESKKICVGFDTRISSSEIYDLLVTGIITRGCDVICLDVCPTSLVGYVTKKEDCDYGIMITASHNPYFDNGIKIFCSKGEKISPLQELEIEELLKGETQFFPSSELGKVINGKEYIEEYISYMKSLIECTYQGKVLVDTSNGVLSDIFCKIFDGKLDYQIINNCPNGKNINDNCGSEHILNLINEFSYSLVVAFDGDGDRLLMLDENKNLITGDDLLYLFSRELNYQKVVTTKMSNLGLEEKLKELNKEVFYSEVGDKKVYKMMKDYSIYIGGESSGHILFYNSQFINDGILTLIKYLNLQNKVIDYPHYFSKTINIRLKDKIDNYILEDLQNRINISLDNGRVYIRKSGTENILRINIQLKDESKYIEVIGKLKEKLPYDELLLL